MFQIDRKRQPDIYEKWLKVMHVKAILPKRICRDTVGKSYLHALATGDAHPSQLIK